MLSVVFKKSVHQLRMK